MTTDGELHQIASALNRIANCMEASEKRQRQTGYQAWVDTNTIEGNCSHEDCLRPVIAMINHVRYCEVHMDEAFARFGQAVKSIETAFGDMEKQVEEARYPTAAEPPTKRGQE